MLSYDRIEADKDLRKLIWRSRERLPRTMRDADAVWTPDYRSFVRFWRACGEIWGLYERDRLVCCVFLEFFDTQAVNVHFAVVEKIPSHEISRFFRSLTAHKGREGVPVRVGFLLERNRELLRIVEDAGYRTTGLKMDYGGSHGRLLRWLEIRG